MIRQRGIKQVPVVDRRNRLVGIVTDRDIRSAVAAIRDEDDELTAADIMSTELITIAPFEGLSQAARILEQHEFGALPVVIGERIVGILSVRDLLRRMIDLLERDKSEVNLCQETEMLH
ncbi:MAG: CBS domain-containing protein [Planctomycetes bacterium]|nr:CBS domain-containing protein [Planctomycetota bacterium]